MRSVVRVHLSPLLNITPKTYGGIAQLGERLPCKQEVTSSNLVISIRDEMNATNLENIVLSVTASLPIHQKTNQLRQTSLSRSCFSMDSVTSFCVLDLSILFFLGCLVN